MDGRACDCAALVLRLALGSMLLADGLLKIVVFALPGSGAFLAWLGFPGWSAYVVAPLEVASGCAMFMGFRSALFAMAMLPMEVAAALAQAPGEGRILGGDPGWLFPAVLAMLSVGVIRFGDGAYCLWRRDPEVRPVAVSTGARRFP